MARKRRVKGYRPPKKSLFYRVIKRMMRLIQPGNSLNRSLGGDVVLLLTLLIFGMFTAYPMVFIINNAFKPLSEILNTSS